MAKVKEIRIGKIVLSLSPKKNPHQEYTVKVFRLLIGPNENLFRDPVVERYYYTDDWKDAVGSLKLMAKEELENQLKIL